MNGNRLALLAGLLGLLGLAACATETPEQEPPALAAGAHSRYELDLRILSSDAFEGRGPCSQAEEKTVRYIAESFADAGLGPGIGDSFYQEVPLVTVSPTDVSGLVFAGATDSELVNRDQVVIWTARQVEDVGIEDSDVVFVGYGIVAPEFDWDDYDGIDVRGKTVVALVNDPGFVTEDSELFKGIAATYYGRWTYKLEEAARHGAAAAFVVHDDEAAGYPWDVVTQTWAGPQLALVASDDDGSKVAVQGWMRRDAAVTLFAGAQVDFDELSKAAAQRGFRARELPLEASARVHNSLEYSQSRNVIGIVPGSARPEESIIFTAHWDHLGRDGSLEGDQIYNGAIDNGAGLAGLLELARAFGEGEKPARSVVFLATTAEESGLFGSQYYTDNPAFNLALTVANINLDVMGVFGPMYDVTVHGFGSSELEELVAATVERQGRRVVPDMSPAGYFFRGDQLSFARRGVPVVYIHSGEDHMRLGPEYGQAKWGEYVTSHYHKVSDEFNEDWDLSGAVMDLELLLRIGWDLANSENFPNWYIDSEFRSIRDQSAQQRASGNGAQ